MYCPKCGKDNSDNAAFCNSCGVSLERVSGQKTSSKHNEIITAKIATKKGEIDNISQVGPVLTVIVGLIFCLLIVGVIIGIPMIIFAIWWSQTRENEKTKLRSEIKELEAELN
jgi:uncharacterized membrane protein YvbJ